MTKFFNREGIFLVDFEENLPPGEALGFAEIWNFWNPGDKAIRLIEWSGGKWITLPPEENNYPQKLGK